ncbi:MAG TPA: hypothetical protein DCL15_04325 [Chloroflexi bacterium]|nr:hypothetical protein [Chloroflexota bacterium]HHW85382.1 hypothetical protein [Chloroflexota bacterium]
MYIRHSTWLIIILLLSVLLRVGVALYLGDSVPAGKDEQSYSELAWRVTTGHGYSFDRSWYPFTPPDTPTAHWSFLYTALVAAVYACAGAHPLVVRLLQAVLAGLLMPYLTWRLAQRVLPPTVCILYSRTDNLQSPISQSPISQSPNLQSPNLQSPNLQSPNLLVFQPPLLAALLSALYAYFVLYGAMVQTEGLFLLAVIWSLERALALQERLSEGELERFESMPLQSGFGAEKHWWRSAPRTLPLAPNFWTADWRLWGVAVTLGVSVAVATLLRQSILPWVVVMLIWLLTVDVITHRQVRWRTLVALAVVVAILLAAILPFTLRNYRVYGGFLLLNSNAGYAMYSAQHPMHGVSFDAYAAAPLPTDLAPMPGNEAQWDRVLMVQGIHFALDDPGRYVSLSVSRAVDYFEFWPKTSSSLLFNIGRLASFTLLLPFMLYGVWVLARSEERGTRGEGRVAWLLAPAALLLFFALFYSLLHILTWAMPRYRLPVDAVLLIFAAAGLSNLLSRMSWCKRTAHADQFK